MGKIQVSFSGGETSAYMAQRIWSEWKDKHELIFVFANTGEEHEETLKFVNTCSIYFGFEVIWVEADVQEGKGNGTKHKIVDYETASRKGEPFERVIEKYQLPSPSAPICTRELKIRPMDSLSREMGFNKAKRAIGIRADEIDRINPDPQFIYPLVKWGVTKPQINGFWESMPFRLNIKSYEGNCKVCFKKGLRKLMTIAQDNPEWFDNVKRWEDKYAHEYHPMFRNYMTANDIIEMAQTNDFERAKDDKYKTWEYIQKDIFGKDLDTSNGCVEGCEII